MELIQSFIAIPEKAAKQQLRQLSTTSNAEVQQQVEKVLKVFQSQKSS
jgi:inorganic triphosphatase YgiF